MMLISPEGTGPGSLGAVKASPAASDFQLANGRVHMQATAPGGARAASPPKKGQGGLSVSLAAQSRSAGDTSASPTAPHGTEESFSRSFLTICGY